MVYTGDRVDLPEGGFMSKVLYKFWGRSRDKDAGFADKVLIRFSERKEVSSFSADLFSSENEDTINNRFKEAKQKIGKYW